MNKIEFLDEHGTFCVKQPENISDLYFPIAGEGGLKSALTPELGGDSKLDQNHFLLEPVSIENLHNNRSTRNFWCQIEGQGNWSATGVSAAQMAEKFTDRQERTELKAGFMWQSIKRQSLRYHLESIITSFIPKEDKVEFMMVELTNTGKEKMSFVPIAAIPIYGRSAYNIRDHRHVTSLLHRTSVTSQGVQVRPVLSFDERGHQINHSIYYVSGVEQDGTVPESCYPTVQEFIGEGGNFEHPRAVLENHRGVGPGTVVEGRESIGGIRFRERTLQPGESITYLIRMGIEENEEDIQRIESKYNDLKAVEETFLQVKEYWKKKVNVSYHTGDPVFDAHMKWISFQPILRRIYGCSFLPHHDYGRGGRGWRDLWQDCLALLLMNPTGVREMLLDNFAGIRIDGTNATIIGTHQGEFIADRNHIARVWMDHGVWPVITTLLYLNITGDMRFLLEENVYFCDQQIRRGTAEDRSFLNQGDTVLRDRQGRICRGSVLEHLLVQNLTAIYEVGEHNEIRLRGADWNDALDMAAENGESVAFTSAYAGNLTSLAAALLKLKEKCEIEKICLAKELRMLWEGSSFLEKEQKNRALEKYLELCSEGVQGEKEEVGIEELAEHLVKMSEQIKEQIRQKEWVSDQEGHSWFNGYYDDHKRQVEGVKENKVHMMLTSQVFSIMAGTASEEQIREITNSADHYLYEKKMGGHRLNTNFGELKTDLGRMFGFSYGDKENGAVFSHMAVMYGNALYQRGHAIEGYKALKSLEEQAADLDSSCIYPGIPEYFNSEGRGMYHYLTGAASWYMLTVITEMFGVHGSWGDLVIEPKLLREQFDENDQVSVELSFAGEKWKIFYNNLEQKEYGTYQIRNVSLDGRDLACEIKKNYAVIKRQQIHQLKSECRHIVVVELG